MKKSFILALVFVFILGFAGSTVAAADSDNPFDDVPQGHWAYDAVVKLSKAGIVRGYSNTTFGGDNLLSRYEMAIIVAKAVSKSEKADAELKGLIDKLTKEYSTELKNLGVRVAKLEAGASSVKISGDTRFQYQKNWDLRDFGNDAYNKDPVERFRERVRLQVAGNVNPDISYQAQLSAQSYTREDLPPMNGLSYGVFGFDTAKVSFKKVLGGVELGRQNLVLGQGLIAYTPGNYDAIKFNFGSKNFYGAISYGDISPSTYYPWTKGQNNQLQTMYWPPSLSTNNTVNITTATATWQLDKALSFSGAVLYSDTSYYPYKVYSIGSKYKDGDYTLSAEVAKNHEASTNNDAYLTSLWYKGANRNKEGSWGIGIDYRVFQPNSLDGMLTNMSEFFNSPGKLSWPEMYGAKGFGIGANYTVSKNAVFSFKYLPGLKTTFNDGGNTIYNTSYGSWPNPIPSGGNTSTGGIGGATNAGPAPNIPAGTSYKPMFNFELNVWF